MIPSWMMVIAGIYCLWALFCWIIAIDRIELGIPLLLWPSMILSIAFYFLYEQFAEPNPFDLSDQSMAYMMLADWGLHDSYIILLPIVSCVSTEKFVSGWKLGEDIPISSEYDFYFWGFVYFAVACLFLGLSNSATTSLAGATIYLIIFIAQLILSGMKFAEIGWNISFVVFLIFVIVGDIIFIIVGSYIFTLFTWGVMFLGHFFASSQ